jgi:hypothetical protein
LVPSIVELLLDKFTSDENLKQLLDVSIESGTDLIDFWGPKISP